MAEVNKRVFYTNIENDEFQLLGSNDDVKHSTSLKSFDQEWFDPISKTGIVCMSGPTLSTL
jgi:magnesium-transporting ATPase (P-type)